MQRTWRKLKFRLDERTRRIAPPLWKYSFLFILLTSFFGVIFLVADFGFSWDPVLRETFNEILNGISYMLMFLYSLQLILLLFPGRPKLSRPNIYAKFGIIIVLGYLIISGFGEAAYFKSIEISRLLQYAVIVFIFLRASGRYSKAIYSIQLHPAKLFLLSFIFIILVGAFLLLLPEATNSPVSFVDALFTSTSAVCVTGLASVDTASQYTWLGKFIIMILIQIGGLGIMTFTSFFGTFMGASSTLHESNALGTMINTKKMSNIVSSLFAVVLLTFFIEGVGVALLYFLSPPDYFADDYSRFFFAMFHAVSAFCNAGFSNLPGNMMNHVFIDNPSLQLVICGLIIFGGLGFFVMSNYLDFIKHKVTNIFRWIARRKKIYKPNLIDINSIIVGRTTLILLILGTLFIFLFESNGAFAGKSFSEKLLFSFFSSVTPRTAGFNTYDFSTLHVSTVLLIIVLMWIGASPGSTGGGIKTTTFALAILNAFTIGRGRKAIHFHGRKISTLSIQHALLLISFSIIVIFIGTIILAQLEPNKSLEVLMFEAFSAFGTVGLSLNLTPTLSESSKYVVIMLMFIGRVQFIAIFLSIIRKSRNNQIKLPEDDLFL